MAVYVDDLVILTKTPEEMQHTKDMFANQFKMKDLGKLHFVSGLVSNRMRKIVECASIKSNT